MLAGRVGLKITGNLRSAGKASNASPARKGPAGLTLGRPNDSSERSHGGLVSGRTEDLVFLFGSVDIVDYVPRSYARQDFGAAFAAQGNIALFEFPC